MGGACSTHSVDEIRIQNFDGKSLRKATALKK